MNTVCRDIFRAIHEGRWLKIEYKNKRGETTRYWIGIKELDVRRRQLTVDGLHLGECRLAELSVYIDSIITSEIVDGTYCAVNKKLVDDIARYPEKYSSLFDNVANLRILNYLEMCNRMDCVPYTRNYALVKLLDRDSFTGEVYPLSDAQFRQVVKYFQYKTDNKKQENDGMLSVRTLAMNELSIYTEKGIYVLAYRELHFDVLEKCFRPDEHIRVCEEFLVDGTKKAAVRKFLDAEDYELLKDFEHNKELIKDRICRRSSIGGNIYRKNGSGYNGYRVDDMPYVIGLGEDIALDLNHEYKAIIKMHEEGRDTYPIKAFFGDLLERPRRFKDYPIALINSNINLDQLLAINNGMKYPVAYVQGPPGTGKTSTIINTIVTAFFNDKTVLFTSYNNHPIDGVFDKLTGLKYNGRRILFPVLRLGNRMKVLEAAEYIKDIYEQAKKIKVFEGTLDKRKDDRKARARELSALLKRYEEVLDLKEREETLQRLIEFQDKNANVSVLLPFTLDLNTRQLNSVKEEINKIGEIKESDAIELLDRNEEEFQQYLYYISAKNIQRLGEERYKELWNVISIADDDERFEAFNAYIGKKENVEKLQRVFPVIVTTCIASHRIGPPEPTFDMVIMDEASQCNTAVSLVPIIRGENLMLVGDPQQLNPVILLDETANEQLRKKYQVADAYDYRANSIYKTFLACDSVSDETLLHNHYRCHRKIIEFNNKKYYNSKLEICTQSAEKEPLVFVDVESESGGDKNTSFAEASQIIDFVLHNKDKNIGIVTPFVNQRMLIEKGLEETGIDNVSCGTVHAFQGDEKDIILFSAAVGNETQAGTYEWLKNNKELINVATSRAREKLIVLADSRNIERLHQEGEDDLYELVNYVRENGETQVTAKKANSRALGVKPFSTETEEAFLETLTHALENIWLSRGRYSIHKEVPVSQVFQENADYAGLFYTGRFDFVVYERHGRAETPVLVIELDGKEHLEDDAVRRRDAQKNEICRSHNMELIRVDNSYARRYNYVKEILTDYFKNTR